jgi:uncharacterized protein YjbI with pentapeptide repeats
MANAEHLSILAQGVDAWNEWRRQNIIVLPDLTGANLISLKLHRIDLSRTDLSRADLTSSFLSRANLYKAVVVGN